MSPTGRRLVSGKHRPKFDAPKPDAAHSEAPVVDPTEQDTAVIDTSALDTAILDTAAVKAAIDDTAVLNTSAENDVATSSSPVPAAQPGRPASAKTAFLKRPVLVATAALAAVGLAAVVGIGVLNRGGGEPDELNVAGGQPSVASSTPTPSRLAEDRAARAKRLKNGVVGGASQSAEDALTSSPSPSPSSASPSASSSPSPKRGNNNGNGNGNTTPVTDGEQCGASFYDEPQNTASGEPFDPNAMTAAHKTLPLGSMVKVTNVANNKTVTVRINDRGPYIDGRCLDLSRASFEAIASLSSGHITVRYVVL